MHSTRPLALLSFALLVACGTSTDEPISASALCSIEQLPALGPIDDGIVLVRPEGYFFASPYGLYRADAFDQEPVRIDTLPLPWGHTIEALVAQGDAIIVAVAGTEWGIYESSDGGATWVARTPEIEPWTLELLSNGERVVMASSGLEEFLELVDGEWISLSGEPPEGESHVGGQLVGFDGDALIINSSYPGGLLRLAPAARQWERLEGLGEWGYTSFLTRPDIRLTVNFNAIFAEIDGEWTETHLLTDFNGDVQLIDAGTHLLALGTRQLRSEDGITWTEDSATQVYGEVSASNLAGRVAWLAEGAVRLSEDGGETWATPELVSDRVSDVRVTASGIHAQSRSWYRHDANAWVGADASYLGSNFSDAGVWTCAERVCSFIPNDGSAVESYDVPYTPHRVFANEHGVFLVGDVDTSTYCEEGEFVLVRLDLETGTLKPAQGLPELPCATRVYEGNLVAVGDDLILSVRYVYGEYYSYASSDGGLTWSAIDTPNAIVTAVVDVEAGRFALFGDTLTQEVEGAFTPLALQLDAATDLVALEGRLVVSTYATSGPSVWTSLDASEWLPAAEIGPVLALDAREGMLAAGTGSAGAWTLSECF